jgi:hypothetical protein
MNAARELPTEHDDPRDALLDAAEEMIRRAIALGLEPQMRARLSRLLPEPVRQQATGNRQPIDVDRVLARAGVVTALRTAVASTRSPHQRSAYAAALVTAEADLAAARGFGTATADPRHDTTDTAPLAPRWDDSRLHKGRAA